MRWKALLLLGCAGVAPASDPQGWSDARWGMSREQVFKVLPRASLLTGPAGDRSYGPEAALAGIPKLQLGRLTMNGKESPILATVLLFFKEGRGLAAVRLRIHNPDADRFEGLRQALEKKYGRAASSGERFARWEFPKTRIELSLGQSSHARPVVLWIHYESTSEF